ncbi:MAG: hypothetical protein LWX07_09835, partial [Bacteroidetes bacterium]|nr:hypothetical protein [Bacteroidota bacterium]
MITRGQIARVHLIFWAVMLFIICLEIIPDIGVYSFEIIITTFISYAGSFVLFFYFGYCSISLKHLDRKTIIRSIVLRLSIVLAATAPIAVIFVALFSADVFKAPPETIFGSLIKYYLSFLEFNFLFAAGGGILRTAV